MEWTKLGGWGTGIRTPIGRVRVCSPTIRRSPSSWESESNKIEERSLYVKGKSCLEAQRCKGTKAQS